MVTGFKLVKSEWVLFLDADTLLLKPIDHYLDLCKKIKLIGCLLEAFRYIGIIMEFNFGKITKLDFYESYLKGLLKM